MKKKRTSTMVSDWRLKKPMYIKKYDDRYTRSVEQLKKFGFSDTETWGLDSVICMFILPRLIRFREIGAGYPGGLTAEKWDAILGQMIFAFDWSLNFEEEKYKGLTDKEKKDNWLRYQVGMDQFAKWFRDLWW